MMKFRLAGSAGNRERRSHSPLMVIAVMSAMVLVPTACATSASDKEGATEYKLRYAHYLGPDSAQSISIEKWAKRIEELTDSKVKIEFFYQGSFVEATEILSAVGDGRADIGYVANFYYPAELTMASVAEIPFVTSNAEALVRTADTLYKASPEFRDEYNQQGVEVLTFNPISANLLGSAKTYGEPAAVKDEKIRAVGNVAGALKALDASPVALDATEIYEAIDRGVIDGYTSFPFEIVTDFGLQEVAPNVVDTGTGNYVLPASVINLNLWKSMPDDVRDAFNTANEEHIDNAIRDLVNVEDRVCTAIIDAGGHVTIWDDTEVASWKADVGQEFRNTWLENVSEKYGDEVASKFLDEYLVELNKNEENSSYIPGIQRCADSE